MKIAFRQRPFFHPPNYITAEIFKINYVLDMIDRIWFLTKERMREYNQLANDTHL